MRTLTAFITKHPLPIYFALTLTLWLGMLMHVSFTASLLTLKPLNLAGQNLRLYSFALAGLLWMEEGPRRARPFLC